MTDADLSTEQRRFAAERSHKDASVANETVRATAQASILINGGAATAILAFLAKDKLDPTVLWVAAWCLVGYVVGVFFGAAMLYCSMRSLDAANQYWEWTALRPSDERLHEKYMEMHGWWSRLKRSFTASMAVFVFSSLFIAFTLSKSPAPQNIPGNDSSPSVVSSPPAR